MTREEAIETIRRCCPKVGNSQCYFESALRELIPELAESEDERIRKELIEFIKWSVDRHFMREDFHQAKRPSEWIAYLEKQKDSKWSPSRDEMGVLYKLCYLSNQITDEDDTKLTRLYQDLKREYFNGHSFENMFPSEKQKEQKPVEPSDDELQRHQDELYNFKVFAAKQAKEHHISFVHDFEWNNFCAELLSYFAEQKPAWSEEDEKQIHQIERVIKFAGCSKQLQEKIHNFLNSLRPQYHGDVTMTEAYKMGKEAGKQEQKSAEWSKEDEKMLNLAIEWAETISGQFSFVDMDSTDFRKIIAWLKSLRPQPSWKPSEEQMNAFRS